MKSFIREKWKIIAIICLIVIGSVFSISIIFKNGKDEERTKVTKNHVMYVSINPQIKIMFTEVYEECVDESGKKYICSNIDDNVTDYVLLNNDAKDFYNDLDFKNKSYLETLIMLCDIARDNKVAFNKIEVITDSKNVNREEIINGVKENSKYEVKFDVLLNVEERIVEEDVIEEFERVKVYYTVKFDTNGGSKIDDRIAEENTTLTDLEKPTKEGYRFVKWEYKNKKFDETTIIKDNITVKAVWEKEKEKTTTEKEKDKTTTSKTTTSKEETISKTIEKSVKNYKFKKKNLYEDSKKRIGVEALYGCESKIKIVVTGPKSKVESLTAKKIDLGVDFKDVKTSGTIEKELYVTNKIDGVEYKVTNPKINARVVVFKKVESTIDKINLNENILISHHETSNSWCGKSYVTTNFKEVFKDYLKSGNSLYMPDKCESDEKNCIPMDEFSKLADQLVVDTAKLNKIVANFEKIKNTKYKNFRDFEFNYDLSEGTIGYRYGYLSIADYYIDSLPDSMDKYQPKLFDAYTGIYTTYGACGTGPGGEELLTEEICKDYNLVCARW